MKQVYVGNVEQYGLEKTNCANSKQACSLTGEARTAKVSVLALTLKRGSASVNSAGVALPLLLIA